MVEILDLLAIGLLGTSRHSGVLDVKDTKVNVFFSQTYQLANYIMGKH